MKKDRTCPHCHTLFEDIDGKIFSNHVRWCDQNPDKDRLAGKSFSDKIRNLNNIRFDNEFGELKQFEVQCHECGKKFLVQEREHQFPLKEHYFCSSHCQHSYSGKQVDPNKIRESVIRSNRSRGIFPKKPIDKICPFCHKHFTTIWEKKVCCSLSCARKYTELKSFNLKIQNASELDKVKLLLKRYRQECQFKFALKDFPDEFDFSLVEKYGWYSAKNRGNNMGGVSRDHMYSVKEGFLNHIDPSIISHPANCRLVLQSENASKKDDCAITLDELMKRIAAWDLKYKNNLSEPPCV